MENFAKFKEGRHFEKFKEITGIEDDGMAMFCIESIGNEMNDEKIKNLLIDCDVNENVDMVVDELRRYLTGFGHSSASVRSESSADLQSVRKENQK